MVSDNLNLFGVADKVARDIAEAIIKEVEGERSLRNEDYVKNWEMYGGRHAAYFKQRLNEANEIFAYRKTHAIKSNLCGFTVDLSARYLYGKSTKIIRKYSTNKETNAKMRSLVKTAAIEAFMLDAAKKAAVFGETVVRIIPVDSVTNKEVKVSTPDTKPKPILLSPISTFVKLNKWKGIDAVVCRYFSKDYTKNVNNTILELIVQDSRWTWISETTGEQKPAYGIGTTESNQYPLNAEFVHFPNNDDLKSDLVDITDLNVALDEALTDKQRFFQVHGWPQLVTEVNLDNVIKEPGKIWDIGVDEGNDRKKITDRMGFLVWDGKMEDHAKFVKNLERYIMILSNTAAISTGDLEAIGQLRSGAALITAHSVAIHKTEAKQIVWDKNEKALYNAMATMDAFLNSETVKARFPELDPKISFPKTFVPGSEMEEAQIHQMELNSHTRSLRDIIQQKNGEFTEEEVYAEREEILQDSRELVDSLREFKTDDTAAGGTSKNTGNAKGKSGTSSQKSKEQKPTVS